MDRLKKVMWWMQCAMLFTGFGLCWVAFRAIDDTILYDAVSHEKIGMAHMLGIVLAICILVWAPVALAYCMHRLMRDNDPDVGTDDDGQYISDDDDVFPFSPRKPR